MPVASVNDVHIHYESYGDGFPLVLTYCLGGNTGMWAGQIAAFSQRYRLIIWDPRGHGGSESPAEPARYGVQQSAEDLKGLLDQLGIETAYIGGLSMGGGIAARFAVSYPERVKALLILDSTTASGLPTSPEMCVVREKTIALCETGDMGAVTDYFLEANPNYHLHAGDSTSGREQLRQMIGSLNPMGFAHTIRAMLQPDFPTERLVQITAPTFLLAGELDPALAAVRLTHQTIPGAVLELIPGAGHLSNLDQPDAFEQKILNFLRGIETDSGV